VIGGPGGDEEWWKRVTVELSRVEWNRWTGIAMLACLEHTWDWFHSVLHREKLPYRYCSLHDAQLLLNKQQQIWGAVCIHLHFSSSTDTVVLLNFDLNQSNLTTKWNYIPCIECLTVLFCVVYTVSELSVSNQIKKLVRYFVAVIAETILHAVLHLCNIVRFSAECSFNQIRDVPDIRLRLQHQIKCSKDAR